MKLNDWRKAQGLTLQQLADALGVTLSFVMRLCNGRRKPGPQLYERIFLLTEGAVTPDDFFPLAMWRARVEAAIAAAKKASLAVLTGRAA